MGELEFYDSHWWQTWRWARSYLATHHADRLDDWDAAFEALRPPPDAGARLLAGVVPDDLRLGMVARIAAMDDVRLEHHELTTFGRHVVHDAFTDLVPWAQELLETTIGIPLEPSYDFLSLYHDTGVCEPHLDAPNASWTLDVLLDQSAPWPLLVAPGAPWLADEDGDVPAPSFDDPAVAWQECTMTPGDAVVFAGPAAWHGRRPMPPQDPPGFCHLAFFHFIPRGTGHLVDPHRWAEVCDVPRLSRVVDLVH